MSAEATQQPRAIVRAGVLDEFLANARALVNEAKIHVEEDGFDLAAVGGGSSGR